MINLYNNDYRDVEIADHTVDLLLVDPPYGSTQLAWDKSIDIDAFMEYAWRVLKENGVLVVFAIETFASHLRLAKYYRYDWIWQKNLATGFLNAKFAPLRDYENIIVFTKHPKSNVYNPQFTQGKPYKDRLARTPPIYHGKSTTTSVRSNPDGRRYPKRILAFGYERNGLHPTQKPVPLMEYLVRTYTNEGMTVLDPFMGSGSTGVACKNLNRNFIGCEIDAGYFETARKRIEG